MTHSLHRIGCPESLKEDYVLIVRPTMGFNNEGSAPKIRRALEIIFEGGPANLGSLESGGTICGGLDKDRVLAELDDKSGIRCTFSSRKKLLEVLRRIKEAELGMSVTVSGIIADVYSMCDELEIEPHSINLSLGVHGNTALLAEEPVRELTTMCGHALIASSLVRKVMSDVKQGKTAPRDAAVEAGMACGCGLFNLDRAERILRELQA